MGWRRHHLIAVVDTTVVPIAAALVTAIGHKIISARAAFEQIQQRGDITIGTGTMEVTYKRADSEADFPTQGRAA